MSTKKKKAVLLQLEQSDFTEAQLLSVKELNDAVKNGSDLEALFMKKQVGDDVKRLTTTYNKLKTEPVELPTIEFVHVKKYRVISTFQAIVKSLVFLYNHLLGVKLISPSSPRTTTLFQGR